MNARQPALLAIPEPTPKRYALKGVNDDESECSVCGKIELKQVMWLVELDEEGCEIGEPFPAGTTCGANLMRRKISHVRQAAKSYSLQAFMERAGMKRKRATDLGYFRKLNELNALGLRYADRQIHPLYTEIRQIDAAAQAWADAQPVLIEL
jgi:hypothetical protein